MINCEMLINCYRKFKSYVFYSNNLNYLYSDIANFENDFANFKKRMTKLTQNLADNNEEFFDNLIGKIEVAPLIKGVKTADKTADDIFTNAVPKPSSVMVESINYFIHCPIELFIIDTLWTLLCFSALKDNISDFKHCYAYYPAKDLIINKSSQSVIERVNFKTLSIYEPYFNKYRDWQEVIVNKAIDRKKKEHLDSKLISLDITSFFYSAYVDFDKITRYLETLSPDFIQYKRITEIVKKIYKSYYLKLKTYSDGDKNLSNLPIPIGLVSSGFVGNYCLLEFDNALNNLPGVVYSSRYVDDILILLDGHLGASFLDLVNTMLSPLIAVDSKEEKIYRIRGTDFVIKNNKTRVFDIKKNSGEYILSRLKKRVFVPSGIHLFPKYVTDFDQLYSKSINSQDSLKIRENIVKPDIIPGKLASSISGLLLTITGCEITKDIMPTTDLYCLIDSYFVISTFSRWPKLFSYFISISSDKFNRFSRFVSSTINKLKFENKNLPLITKNAVYKYLIHLYETAVAESIAPLGKKELTGESISKKINELSKLLRNSNLFDHNLVLFPLANYLVGAGTKSFLEFERFADKSNSIDGAKILLSPRFIHLDEYLYYIQCNIVLSDLKEINYDSLSDYYYQNILPIFSSKKEKLFIKKEIHGGYNLFSINYVTKDKNFDDVPIAIANIDLSKYRLTRGYGYKAKLTYTKGTPREKSILLDLLNDCYYKKVVRKNKKVEDASAKFLVFPEYYLPLEWLSILIKFSRKSGIVIVTGLRPIKIKKVVHNIQAVIVPFTDTYGHNESMVFLREKNNYAPLDKQVIHNSGCVCSDSKNPSYFIFNNKRIRFSTLICYELTDVCARSLLKNNVDITITSEYNEDIYYFSNIVESSARDLSSFIVQVNSSNYGDSRIVAPYRDKYKEIASITGGVKESVHIGVIKLKEYKDYLSDFVACDKLSNYEKINPTYTKKTVKYKKFKKPSAGIK